MAVWPTASARARRGGETVSNPSGRGTHYDVSHARTSCSAATHVRSSHLQRPRVPAPSPQLSAVPNRPFATGATAVASSADRRCSRPRQLVSRAGTCARRQHRHPQLAIYVTVRAFAATAPRAQTARRRRQRRAAGGGWRWRERRRRRRRTTRGWVSGWRWRWSIHVEAGGGDGVVATADHKRQRRRTTECITTSVTPHHVEPDEHGADARRAGGVHPWFAHQAAGGPLDAARAREATLGTGIRSIGGSTSPQATPTTAGRSQCRCPTPSRWRCRWLG